MKEVKEEVKEAKEVVKEGEGSQMKVVKEAKEVKEEVKDVYISLWLPIFQGLVMRVGADQLERNFEVGYKRCVPKALKTSITEG